MAVKSVEEFKMYLLQEEKSENTVEKYMRDVLAFVKWCEHPVGDGAHDVPKDGAHAVPYNIA